MPNRANDLVWEDSAAGQTRLSRSQVVEQAIAIADAEGLAAVSIRKVAAKLRMRPMSLYTHVASKDDLVALMLNEVSRELLVETSRSSGWREALRDIARVALSAYKAHPWMLGVFGQGTRVGPNQLRRAEQSAAAVDGLSPEPSDRWMALQIVHEWTIGHALHVLTLQEDEQLREQLRDAPASEFPHMAQVFRRSESEDDVAFDAALEAVLDGVEARFGRTEKQGH